MTAAPDPDRPRSLGVRARLEEARQRQRRWLHNSAMGGLLALLVVSIFVVPPLINFGDDGSLIDDVLLTLIFLIGVIAVLEHHRFAVALVVVSSVVVAVRWTAALFPATMQPILPELSTVGALCILSTAVGISVFTGTRPVADRISGAIVLFLLLGVMWAFVYLAIDVTIPDAFAGAQKRAPIVFEWIYYSFITLTTTGYGDITPVHKIARSLAILEALVGQLYPAIIIARLVSLESTK